MKTSLDYGITVDADKIVANLFKYSSSNLGEHQNIDAVAVKEILATAG